MNKININDTMDYNSMVNYMKEHTQPKHASTIIDVDTVELSGISKAVVESVRSSGKAVHIDSPEYDDLFSAIDIALQEQKKQTEEHVKFMKKYREKQEKLKRIQDQKAIVKATLMENSGHIWTSELSAASKHVVMSKAAKALSDYHHEEEIKEKKREER